MKCKCVDNEILKIACTYGGSFRGWECKKVTKTFTVFVDEGVEALKEKVQTAFKLTSQPSLKLGDKDISNEWLKEEAIRSDDLIRSGDTKRITLNCEIFTPWDISASDESGINYKRLVDEFGVELVTDEIVSRVERLTNRSAHPWLRRKFFFSHRGFDKILDTVEAGDTYYLYTGRGPSSTSLHLGHMIQFMFAKYLQEAFGVVLVIQMSDDEKFLFKKDLSLDEVKKMAFDNARDIVALGFDPTRTYIFSDISEIGSMYECVLQLLKNTPAHLEEMIFGFNGHSPAGFYMWPCVQAAPAFSCTFPEIFGPPRYDIATNQYFGPTEPINKKKEKEKDSKNKKKKDKKKDTKEGDQQSNEQPQSEWAIPCLIPCAIDQDPYFRMCRDLASGIGHPPPCTLLSRFVPGFSGVGTKMSASVQHDTTSSSSGSQNKQKEKVIPQTVFMNDNLKIIKLAVNSAFSIGANTLKEQEETGTADKHIELDVAFQYLKIFDLETNDKVLERVGNIYLYGKQLYEIERIEKKEEDKQIDSQQQKIPWGNQSQESIDQFLSEYRGSVTVGMLKLRLIDVLHEMTQKHQNARSKVTDEDVRKFMSRRRMIGNRIIRNEQNEEMKEEKAILAVVHLSGNKGSLQVLADEKIHLDLIEITFILSRVKQLDQFEHIFGASLLGLASLGLNQKVQKDYEEQRRRILIISERVLQLASQRNIINNDKNRQDQENSITDELNDEE
ncbi:MAG: putative Tryptophan--tRNA ligase, partial [Streblomastix strix]